METTPEQTKPWSAAQAYCLAIICLLVGIITGYLVHPPPPTKAATTQEMQQIAGSAPSMVQVPPEQAGPQQVAPEQLKQMADSQAAPLLEQLKTRPNDKALLEQVAANYFAAHQFETAAMYYERSVAVKADAKILTRLASAYYFTGDADKAIGALNRALLIDPKYADALFNLGMIQWRAKANPKAAVESWERLLKTNPNHPRREQVKEQIASVKRQMSIAPGTKTDRPGM